MANGPHFADVPTARIVPMLADEGVYPGSESRMARALREHGQNAHRGRAKAPRATRPLGASSDSSRNARLSRPRLPGSPTPIS